MGNEAKQAELMQEARQEDQDFHYGIAKISQGLRKFRNGSENFAFLAKFRYGHIFAMIAKIRYHRKNSNFRYACNFRYDSEISRS